MASKKRVTIADIARHAGVSPGAVSFALNGRPGVSAQTRQRILDVAAQFRWSPHSAARALVGARADVVGLVVRRSAGSLGTETSVTGFVAGMQSELSTRQIAMQMVLVASVEAEIATYRRWRSANQVDGVVVIDPRDDDPRFEVLREISMPAIVIGSRESAPHEPAAVWLDDAQVAHDLFDHLCSLGHRRVCYVSGPAELQHTRIRAEILGGLASRGVRGETFVTDSSPVQAAAAVRTVLDRGLPPAAIVFDNEVMAIAGHRVVQERGLRVPHEVSLASFDDSVVASVVSPSITCISRDAFALGADAARFLLDQLATTQVLADRRAQQPVLTVRESTAAV